MSLLIRHARVLTLAQPKAGARRGKALRELGVIARGDVLVEVDQITAVGPNLPVPRDAEVTEADGRVLLPGFVDCHTHACWAGGDRLDEWEQVLNGRPAAEIKQRGGGLAHTVNAVREATRKQLAANLRSRLDLMLAAGTTTVEVKSGYGLTQEAELKLLHAIQRAAQEWPGTVRATALLGHALDGQAADYPREVVRELLPAVWHEFPGITVEARCAEDGWPLEACLRLFERAHKHGLPLRAQADEFGPTGLVPELVKLHARAVAQLEGATKADLLALAASETMAVMLPAKSLHTGGRYFRGGAFVDSGGALALATSCNPATAPTHSMPLVIALAVRYGGLTPAEAIVASTVNAAAVLGLTDRGTIEPGKRADLVLLRHRDERQLAHELGDNPVAAVICGGRKV